MTTLSALLLRVFVPFAAGYFLSFLYRAVNAETARILAGKFTYINRESDMGVEGIREAKTRYHPHHMIEVHLLKRDELEEVL